MLALSACEAASVRIMGPGIAGGAGGGGGGAGSGGGSSSLVGHWRNLLQTSGPGGEFIVVETRWRFDAGGACSKTVLQTFVDREQQFVESMLCTWTASESHVAILREGSSAPATFSYRFVGPDLFIDGFRFIRF